MRVVLLLCAVIYGAPAQACDGMVFDGARFTVCTVNIGESDLRLFLRDRDGNILGGFTQVENTLQPEQRLHMAMNAGMFHINRAPVGLYIENGVQETPIITTQGPGNFGLLPNGVLCWTNQRAMIVESRAFAAAPPACDFATQSGPMLVIDGDLHPRFLPNGSSINIRNGAGVDATGQTLYLVISNDPVNFHHFGRFFRDHLRINTALYLDGRISRLYAPDIGRVDRGLPIGPIIGTVVDVPPSIR